MEGIHKKLWRRRTKTYQINHLVIYPTLSCNLNCGYCYYKDNSQQKLRFEDFKDAFYSFLRVAEKPKVTILGGEPLLVDELLCDIVREIRKGPVWVHINVFTNSIILNENILKMLLKNNVNITVSLDGSKKYNDKYRRFPNDNSSVYDAVIDNIKRYKLHLFSSVNMVVKKDTVDSFFENFKHIVSIGFRKIGFSIDYSDEWSFDDVTRIIQQVRKIISFTVDFNKKTKSPIVFSNMYEIAQKAIDVCSFVGCNNIILLNDGGLYVCDKIVGVRNKDDFRINEFSDRDAFFKKLEQKGIYPTPILCKVGYYLYGKYVRCYDEKEISNRLKIISLMHVSISKMFENYFKVVMKKEFFKRVYGI